MPEILFNFCNDKVGYTCVLGIIYRYSKIDDCLIYAKRMIKTTDKKRFSLVFDASTNICINIHDANTDPVVFYECRFPRL